jgi:hypothetical protein
MGDIHGTPDRYREPSLEIGSSSRQARFKRDTLNLHILIFDENRGENSTKTYDKMMEEIGLYFRRELGLTKKELNKNKKEDKDSESKNSSKDESILDKAKGVLG